MTSARGLPHRNVTLRAAELRWLCRRRDELAAQSAINATGNVTHSALTSTLKVIAEAEKLIDRILAKKSEEGDTERARASEIAAMSLEELYALSASLTSRLADLRESHRRL
jgi:hypothetical protein